MTLTIEITSDFICPWCLIAHHNLQQAIAQLEAPVDIQWVWHPFELNPDMPATGMDRRAYRTNKFGSWAYSQQLDAQTIQAGMANGVEFRYDLMQKTPNTLNAHRLTELAANVGKATDMAERILQAYFTEGEDIGDIETLSALATEVGLNGDQVNAFLLSDEGISEVRDSKQQAIAQGIQSVPTMQIGDAVWVGGQPVDVFLSALQTAQDLEVIKS
ncbi:putative dithiol-disulfide isomerase involved in polyketide biosynthesis [Leptolyngbya sp. PCC 7375]|nr:putative dithiol-disulfide isomerase involved in polyketide biosynthesis [Leptolyngbya sp. PCC 7375]